MKNILIIGCGHMGSALLKLWSENKSNKFAIIDPIKYKYIKNKFRNRKITTAKSLTEIKNYQIFDIIVLAVTPQLASQVLKNYKKLSYKKNCVIVSIMAGVKIKTLKIFFPKINQFIRVMPNMPSLIGEGVSCIVASSKTTKQNKNKIYKLFSKVGLAIWLKNEKEINIATAISGSGPGYIFHLIDGFEKAAEKLGLSKKINSEIILQTFLGSINLMRQSKKTSKELAQNIAISGGTTEAGINVMKKNKVHRILSSTLFTAFTKANRLGQK